MGGRRNKHRLSNVLWLCSITNGLIESDSQMASEARDRGIKISLHANPETIPVHYPDKRVFYLNDDGTRREVDTTPY